MTEEHKRDVGEIEAESLDKLIDAYIDPDGNQLFLMTDVAVNMPELLAGMAMVDTLHNYLKQRVEGNMELASKINKRVAKLGDKPKLPDVHMEIRPKPTKLSFWKWLFTGCKRQRKQVLPTSNNEKEWKQLAQAYSERLEYDDKRQKIVDTLKTETKQESLPVLSAEWERHYMHRRRGIHAEGRMGAIDLIKEHLATRPMEEEKDSGFLGERGGL